MPRLGRLESRTLRTEPHLSERPEMLMLPSARSATDWARDSTAAAHNSIAAPAAPRTERTTDASLVPPLLC